MKIKAYVKMDVYNKVHKSRGFEVVESVKVGELLFGKEVKKIDPVNLDYEQGGDEVYSYDYYRVETEQDGEYNPDEDIYELYWVAVEKEEEE